MTVLACDSSMSQTSVNIQLRRVWCGTSHREGLPCCDCTVLTYQCAIVLPPDAVWYAQCCLQPSMLSVVYIASTACSVQLAINSGPIGSCYSTPCSIVEGSLLEQSFGPLRTGCEECICCAMKTIPVLTNSIMP